MASLGGRSLAHTGGTLDKLEAIPGFRSDLPLARFVRQVRDVGIAVSADTTRLAPGDRPPARAARRDRHRARAPGWSRHRSMSAAIAGGAGAVHVDVKAGPGGCCGRRGRGPRDRRS